MAKTSKTMLPDARVSPRFAGIPTFCRYPRIEDVKGSVDWAIYGVPFDGGVTYRPGARIGPRAIRVESQYVKRYSIEQDVDVCEVLSIADAGDAPVAPYDCAKNAKMQAEFALGLGTKKTKLFAVGGDHTIAYGNMRATWERLGGREKPKGGLALVHFDSHLDTVDAVWGEKWGHASVFRRAIEEEIVNPKKMLSVGVKGPLNSREDLAYARRHGVRVVTHSDLVAGGDAELEAFVAERGAEPVYVTFDIDCVDPAYAPGTGTPSVGGLTSSEALTLLRMLRGLSIAGADVVEVLPDRDPQGITALLAAHVMFEILALDAVARV